MNRPGGGGSTLTLPTCSSMLPPPPLLLLHPTPRTTPFPCRTTSGCRGARLAHPPPHPLASPGRLLVQVDIGLQNAGVYLGREFGSKMAFIWAVSSPTPCGLPHSCSAWHCDLFPSIALLLFCEVLLLPCQALPGVLDVCAAAAAALPGCSMLLPDMAPLLLLLLVLRLQVGLLAAGQSSVMTGTFAGQFAMSGFLDIKASVAVSCTCTGWPKRRKCGC